MLYFAYLANTPNVRLTNPFLRTTDFAGRVGFGAAGLETYPFALPLLWLFAKFPLDKCPLAACFDELFRDGPVGRPFG